MEKVQKHFSGQIECISLLRLIGAIGVALYHMGFLNEYVKSLQGGKPFLYNQRVFNDVHDTKKACELSNKETDTNYPALLDNDNCNIFGYEDVTRNGFRRGKHRRIYKVNAFCSISSSCYEVSGCCEANGRAGLDTVL